MNPTERKMLAAALRVVAAGSALTPALIDRIAAIELLPSRQEGAHYAILPVYGAGQDYAFWCSICDRVSYNGNDVRNRYCGACNLFHTNKIPQHV